MRNHHVRSSIPCTLLVPATLLNRARLPRGRSLVKLLEFMLRTMGDPKPERTRERATARYQHGNHDLQRLHVRIPPGVWFQLGSLARLLGVSRCRAFVALLRLYLARSVRGVVANWRERWNRLLLVEEAQQDNHGRFVTRVAFCLEPLLPSGYREMLRDRMRTMG